MNVVWSKQRVLVTGATGLLGSVLVRTLVDRDAYVAVLLRDWEPDCELIRSGTVRNVRVVQGMLEDYRTLERAVLDHGVDTVFHLGAQTIVGAALRSPLLTFEANVRGTYNLLEVCRLHSDMVERVIVASSDKAYGASARLPYVEDMPLLGRAPYDVSKACVDLIAQSYHATFGLPVVVTRCGNIFGGGDLNWSRIVPGTIRSVYRGERPIVRSDGTFVRDYIYVRDVVNALMQLGAVADQRGIRGEAFNFGPERPLTVLEIVAKILRLMDREDLNPVILNRAQAEIPAQYLSSAKAAHILGWFPTYSVDDGLSETISWYRSFLGAREVVP